MPTTPAGVAFRAVLLAYVAAIGAFSREFAHLHVTLAGVPLFAGELTLVALGGLAAAHLLVTHRRPLRMDGVTVAIAGFVLVGAVHAAVGLVRGFGIAALRDFALAYYAAFFPLALVYRAAGGPPNALAAAFAAGATVGGLLAIARLVATPALDWGHGVPGHQALLAWVAVLAALVPPPPRSASGRAARRLAVAVNAAVVLLSGYRTMLVVLAGVAAASGLALARWRRPALRRVLAAALAGLLAWGAIVLAIAVSPRPAAWPWEDNGPMSLGRALYMVAARWAMVAPGSWAHDERPAAGRKTVPEWGSVPSAGEKQPTRRDGAGRPAATPPPPRPAPVKAPAPSGSRSFGFRLLTWQRALERVRTSPILGIGFGPAPNLHPDRHCQLLNLPASNCGNAHNTYLTVAMRMGVPVLLGLLLLNGVVLTRALRALRAAADPRREADLVLALTVVASFALYAATSLFLESPYLSSLYWTVLGLTHVLDERSGSS
jgi:hypothetical protein